MSRHRPPALWPLITPMATGRPRAKDSDDPDDPWRHISSFLADGNLARELNAERVARQAPDADEEEM